MFKVNSEQCLRIIALCPLDLPVAFRFYSGSTNFDIEQIFKDLSGALHPNQRLWQNRQLQHLNDKIFGQIQYPTVSLPWLLRLITITMLDVYYNRQLALTHYV